MEIIRTVNLEKVYQENGVPVRAVKNLTLTIAQGEFLAVAGPSGSGKTTLLNMLGALDMPTGGRVFIENENLYEKDRRELSSFRLHKLGFIFQAYNLIPVLTAIENIEFKMMLLGIEERTRRQQALEVMEELGIREYADKRPHEMSGGQQQRVAVARAIVNNPPIVLADEPTANLDSATAHSLIDIMERMNIERNITFVFSSHDAQVLERARRVVLLKDGMLSSDTRRQ